MKALEKAADEAGLSYYQMMENAGTCASVIIMGACPEMIRGGKAVIFCGKGNNGGDGFAVARILKGYGADVTVILVEGRPVTDDAARNCGLLEPLDVALRSIDEKDIARTVCGADVIVDAIYGTGFHGKLRPHAARAVDMINFAKENGSKVIALDLPSGLPGDIDEDAPVGSSVHADNTVTFHAFKQIHKNKAALKVMGSLTVADIGIHDALKGTIRD